MLQIYLNINLILIISNKLSFVVIFAFMNLHEYQGKEILEKFNVKVQKGYVADNIEDAVNCAQKIQKETGTGIFVIKAQIHAGGRGKAGGMKLVKNKDVLKEASNMLGKILITPQTGSKGKKVKRFRRKKNKRGRGQKNANGRVQTILF